jgi:DNA polymerase-3 subunit delta
VAGGSHALDILMAPDTLEIGEAPLLVLHGADSFLTRHLLGLIRDRLCPDEADRAWAWREFDGTDPLDPRDVFDEAATVPLFATATRAAVVRQADGFVSAHRELLEKLAGSPRGRRGLVILEVKSFPGNTRLAKAAAKQGLVIDTAVTAKQNLVAWARKWAETTHGIKLATATAQQLLERVGGQFGLLDQALARLAAATPAADRGKQIPPEAIDDFVGTPGERSAWGMIDDAGSGRTPAALQELALLVQQGENPIAIAAQASAVLRKLATAARLLALPPNQGRPASVEAALREAGVAAWPKAMEQARAALGQLGGARARRLPIWLMELDLSLKGEASRGLRARLALERLFCKMCRQETDAALRPRSRESL